MVEVSAVKVDDVLYTPRGHEARVLEIKGHRVKMEVKGRGRYWLTPRQLLNYQRRSRPS